MQRRRAVREREGNFFFLFFFVDFAHNAFFPPLLETFHCHPASSSFRSPPTMTAKTKKGHAHPYVHTHPPFATMCVLLSKLFRVFRGEKSKKRSKIQRIQKSRGSETRLFSLLLLSLCLSLSLVKHANL